MSAVTKYTCRLAFDPFLSKKDQIIEMTGLRLDLGPSLSPELAFSPTEEAWET